MGVVNQPPSVDTTRPSQWTFSIAVNLAGSIMRGAAGGGTAINLGYSSATGFSVSITGAYELGGANSRAALSGITIGITDAPSVDALLGQSVEYSRSVGKVVVTGIASSGYEGISVTIPVISSKSSIQIPGASAASVTNTSAIIQWEQNRGVSFLKDQPTGGGK